MRVFLVALFIWVAIAQAAHPRIQSSPHLSAFEAWKTKFNKAYETIVEEVQRFETWVANAKYVMEHNLKYELGLSSFKVGMNKFADMSQEEFAAIYLSSLMPSQPQNNDNNEQSSSFAPKALPTTYNWATMGWVTPVKDQGQCGSCWSFSSTGALEGQHYNQTKNLVSLSEQQLVSCDHTCFGCGGGNQGFAFTWWQKHGGAVSEQDYPYKSGDGKNYACETGFPIAAEIIGHQNVKPQKNEAVLQQACYDIGPIAISIDANHMSFQLYESGVYYDSECSSTNLDHAVLLTGWGVDSSNSQYPDYWIVKNSWGTAWGQEGYIWMARNANNNCGVATDPLYPLAPSS